MKITPDFWLFNVGIHTRKIGSMAAGNIELLERMRGSRSGIYAAQFFGQGVCHYGRPSHRHLGGPTGGAGEKGRARRPNMKRDLEYYDGLPWRVIIDPEREDDGRIIFVASHPEFDGVLGTGETPEAALADLHAARRSMIEALLAEGYPIPEPSVAPSAVE